MNEYNVYLDRLERGEFSSTTEALNLYAKALHFNVRTFPESTEEDRDDASIASALAQSYREKLKEMEEELIQKWSGKSEIHDQIIGAIQSKDFTRLMRKRCTK